MARHAEVALPTFPSAGKTGERARGRARNIPNEQEVIRGKEGTGNPSSPG